MPQPTLRKNPGDFSLRKLVTLSIAAGALVVLAGPASAGVAGVGGASIVGHSPYQPVSVGQGYMPTIERFAQLRRRRNLPPGSNRVTYHGGPVLMTPQPVVILWGFKSAGDPDGIAALYGKFAASYGSTTYADIATQYFELLSGKQTWPKISKNGVIWEDNTNPIPANPSETDVQNEAWRAAEHFNYANLSGNNYIVVSAYRHDPQGVFSKGECAHHRASELGLLSLSYTNMPYMPDAGASCGAYFIAPPSDESGLDEGQTIVTGHEYNESQSDPYLNAWFSSTGEEIGDLCAWQDIANDTFGKYSFTMQPEWSNVQNGCVHQRP